MENCYVVMTKNAELARRELMNQNFGTWMPLVKEFRKGKGHIMRPMFPGYLFVFFDPDLERWRAINGTRGVRRLIMMTEDRPTALPKRWVDEMMANAEKWLQEKELEVGMKVEILEGAFEGHEGTCVLSGSKRVQILLHCLGSEIRVSLEKEKVVSLR